MTDQYFRPRNWHKFQHYKDRQPPWIKLHSDILDREEFRQLPDATKAHLMCLWVLYARVGRPLPVSSVYLSRLLGVTSRFLGRSLDMLFSSNFIELCHKDASIVLAPRKHGASLETETETETYIPPYIPPKGKRAILTDLSDWTPSNENRAYAEQRNLDPDRVLADIQDWAANAPASKRRKKDPSRFWQTWCRREADRVPRPKANGHGPPGLVATANELIRKHREAENGHLREDNQGTDQAQGRDPPALPGRH